MDGVTNERTDERTNGIYNLIAANVDAWYCGYEKGQTINIQIPFVRPSTRPFVCPFVSPSVIFYITQLILRF